MIILGPPEMQREKKALSQPPVRSDEVRGKQFSTQDRGYDKTQVDAFVEAAGLRLAAMESTDRPAGALVSGDILFGWAEWVESTTFETHPEAYDMAEVDAFRERIRDTFLGASEPPVRAHSVRGKQFSSTDADHGGYDKKQVAAFLDAAGIRLAAMESTDLAAMESTDRPAGPLVSGALLADGPSGPTQQDFQPPRWAEWAAWAEWADSTRFSTTPRKGGYDTAEVDAFRQEIRDTFLGTSQRPVRADDVRGKRFKMARRGYDVVQVDAFCDEAEQRLAAMRPTDKPDGSVSGAILTGWAEWADSTRFSTSRLRVGRYDTAEVDAFREAIRDTFLGVSGPPLTWPAADGKQFPTTRRLRAGYDPEQVDAFLDKAEPRLAAMRATDKGATAPF